MSRWPRGGNPPCPRAFPRTLAGGAAPTGIHSYVGAALTGRQTPDLGTKNLLGLPWRVALALQDDGWIIRNAIVWHKPNAMPESVRDRLNCRYELIGSPPIPSPP